MAPTARRSSTPDPSRRPGRPPRLSREAVVTAAGTIVAQEGIEALTMRRVAEKLDSSPMSIYRHVRDKDELLVLLLKACRAMRDGLAEHPWVVDVLAGGDLIAPSILWLMEEIVAGFVACGLGYTQAADGYHAVWQFTVGELIVRRGLDRVAALDRPPYVLGVLTSVDPRELPTLAALAGHWAPTRGRDSYDIGLGALIAGLLAAADGPVDSTEQIR